MLTLSKSTAQQLVTVIVQENTTQENNVNATTSLLDLSDLEMDNIFYDIEDELSIQFSEKERENFVTVGDLILAVKGKLNS